MRRGHRGHHNGRIVSPHRARDAASEWDYMTTTASKASKAAASTYTADNIQVLEGLEAVRRRPGMYIGSTDSRGINHLFSEIVDNSTDEGVAGRPG